MAVIRDGGRMKNWKAYLLACVLLALCLLAVWNSNAFQHCIQASEGYAGGQTIKERATNILPLLNTHLGCTGELLHRNAEAITGLFTLILAISTILLWRATGAAADAAKTAAAYIPTVEGAHVYVVIKIDEIFEHIRVGKNAEGADFEIPIYIALSNFGKTPAFIERFTARLSYASTAKQLSGLEARIQPNTIVAAGDETQPPLRVAAPPLSPTDAEEIWRAAASLILDGTLVYRDIWGGKWTVRFAGRTDNDNSRFRLDNYPRKKTK